MKRQAAVLAALLLSTVLHAAPQFRFGELTVRPDKTEVYRQAIRKDIAATLPAEAAAFTMFALPKTGQTNDFFVVEIYQSPEAEQLHRQQDWYKQFVAETEGIYPERKLIEAAPRFINEGGNRLDLDGGYAVRLSRYQATDPKTDLVPPYRGRRGSLGGGRLATYLVQSEKEAAQWYVLDVYPDYAALQRDNPGDIFGSRAALQESFVLDGGLMMSKGRLVYPQ